MSWLCRLVTPPSGLVLDPFAGSGSTGCACVREGFSFLGYELSPEYAKLARLRIAHHEQLAADEAPLLKLAGVDVKQRREEIETQLSLLAAAGLT
jgi:site-specific DNA-methyltransferase (adenine-specific)